MSFGSRVALFRLEHRLRALQNRYYDARTNDDAAILEYFRVLQTAREMYLGEYSSSERRIRVHLGSGDHRLPGWINVDISPSMPVDVAADLTRSFPLLSSSVDLIHSEDFIEHVDRAAGLAILAECHRVLRPGGVMRVLTPDLRGLIEQVYVRKERRHLRWCSREFDTGGPCDALNMHLRMNGEHRYVYDQERLTDVLHANGFEVRRVRYNWSSVPELRYLDLRNFGLTLFIEATKH